MIRQAQEAISEGFICANCRKQFDDVPELLTHYDLCGKLGAGGSGEENGASSGLKSIFGKARQKLRFDSSSPQLQQQQLSSTNYSSSSSSPFGGGGAYGGGQSSGSSSFQDKSSPTPIYFNDFDTASEVLGESRSSFEDFKRIRAGRLERYAAESNKLKIRLSKLVSGLEKFPSLMTKSTAGFQDSAEWKSHEKSVVNWLEEKPVTRCPECALGFSLLKRKHHCRLCGSILCHDCSDFIPLLEAFEILHSEKKIRDDTASASITFRTCAHCARILRQESQSPFSQFHKKSSRDSSEKRLLELYDTIRGKMTEIDNLQPQLVTVVESIKSGETLYSRDEANSLRSKLLRANEQIDFLSKQISALEKSESSSMQMLQQRIRQSCIAYIRDFINRVPIVPDTADDSSSTSSSLGGASSIILTGDGWSISAPDHSSGGRGGQHDDAMMTSSSIDMDDNPIKQQIKNVKFYIQQAQAAGRMDEVDMLASSLRDLLLFQNEQSGK